MTLVGVFLGGVTLDVCREAFPENAEARASHKVRGKTEVDGMSGYLRAVCSFSLSSRAQGQRKPYQKTQACFDVVFDAESGELSQEMAAMLGRDAVQVCWPYLRELVDTLSFRAAVPIPTLPFLTDEVLESVLSEQKASRSDG